jgi:hypothetical protein
MCHELTATHAPDEPKECVSRSHPNRAGEAELLDRVIDCMSGINGAASIVAMEGSPSAKCRRKNQTLIVIE